MSLIFFIFQSTNTPAPCHSEGRSLARRIPGMPVVNMISTLRRQIFDTVAHAESFSTGSQRLTNVTLFYGKAAMIWQALRTGAQDFPNLAVDFRRIAARLVHHVGPFFGVFIQLHL